MKILINNTLQKEQNLASNPKYSIWVNAHAGTGKTKILVDRILRILLNGINHREILCITYTKAAASEINQRIINILSYWSHIEEKVLITELKNLGIDNINNELIFNARTLCNTLLDSNIPLKIQTIHGFCQNLLETFFIEAEIPSNFKVIEDNNTKYLEIQNEVYNKTLIELLSSKNINLNNILGCFSEKTLETLIKHNLLKYNLELNTINKNYPNVIDLKKIIYKFFNTDPNIDLNTEQYLLYNCSNTAIDYNAFKELLHDLNNNLKNLSNTEKTLFHTMHHYLDLTPEKRSKDFNNWYHIFFTKDHTPKKKIFTNKTINNYINTINFTKLFYKEISRLQIIKNWLYATHNFEIFKLALYTNKIYNDIKFQLNFLDYNDLLQKALNLLNKEQFIPWVFYTFNQRISHILIDEAQDTSPLQWEIIKIISKEIFSTPEQSKSIFIVGDIKQSIFSFQGANPEVLSEIKNYMKNLVTTTNYTWKEININISFRSSKVIIDFVNKICPTLFSDSPIIQDNNTLHGCFNKDLPGSVTIWPIIYSTNPNQNPEITQNSEIEFKKPHHYILAESVANKINHLITKELYQPKDIMILASKRADNLTINHLIKLLKYNNIPTSGIDKFSLLEHLAIMDILSIAKFLLQPLNNLNLATLLKTPIFNYNDEELCKIILEEPKKYLWHSLKEKTQDKKFFTSIKKLNHWQNLLINKLSLFELFNTILFEENLCHIYIEYFGAEVLDLFSQFINLIIQFENQTTNTSLENLIYYLDNINPVIKRETNSNINEIRFLTIHGSKGLESKVIFLLDNTFNNNYNSIIQTYNKDLPIIFNLSKTKGYTTNCLDSLLNKNKKALEEENKRLFYVAITRAKEKLFICTSAEEAQKENKTTRFYKFIKDHTYTN